MRCADLVNDNGLLTLGVSNATTCDPSQVVLLSPAEYGQLVNSPMQMTPADGAQVAGAVAMCWAVAWGVRMVIRVIRDSTADGSAEADNG